MCVGEGGGNEVELLTPHTKIKKYQRPKTRKLLENVGRNHQDVGLGNDLAANIEDQATQEKVDRLAFMKDFFFLNLCVKDIPCAPQPEGLRAKDKTAAVTVAELSAASRAS